MCSVMSRNDTWYPQIVSEAFLTAMTRTIRHLKYGRIRVPIFGMFTFEGLGE